jgi:Zn-dependent protease
MRPMINRLQAGFILTIKSTKLFTAFKLFKFSKPIITMLSMCISALLYGAAYGPLFGVLLVAVLFIHEMGHVMAIRQRGMPVQGPIFIPFLGAAVFLPDMGDRETEAWIGIGGPVVGMTFAALCWVLYEVTGWGIMLPVAYIGVILNLFNLIPLSPLDGGRILQPLGVWPKYFGIVALFALTLWRHDPGLLMIWILCLDSFGSARGYTPKLGMSVCLCFLGLVTVKNPSGQRCLIWSWHLCWFSCFTRGTEPCLRLTMPEQFWPLTNARCPTSQQGSATRLRI